MAAGASKRLGHPKALVDVGTTTLVGLAVRRLLAAGCEPVVVVTRQSLQFDVMTQALNATVIVNPDPEAGRTGSVQRGLLALMGDKGRTPRKVIIAPVDRPGWSTAHAVQLMQHEVTTNLSCGGTKGHPLLLHDPDIERILAANPTTPLRDLIRPQACDVEAPHLSLNIDTPDDLDALVAVQRALLEG
ncbi:MAG: NTP transferase domain-containing protein [Candidatus Poseidoniaceae archaeon]|nr:NTP transferase domain-containing protein [Candidatus Poseidoniaceae archaeon]